MTGEKITLKQAVAAENSDLTNLTCHFHGVYRLSQKYIDTCSLSRIWYG